MTPFEAIYRKNPPSILSYIPSVSKVQEVDNNLIVQGTILRTLESNFFMAQNRMNQQANQGLFEHHFVEGDQMFLHLQPYK
jgi:hypothetical protein